MSLREKIADTPADAAVAASRTMPAEKKLGRNYPPCPHCAGKQLVFHCSDKTECTWLRCVDCGALIEPSDWSHAYEGHGLNAGLSHGKTLFKFCSGK